MSATFGTFAVGPAANAPFATWKTDNKVSRVDFQVRNVGNNTVTVSVVEQQADGTLPATLLSNKSVVSGGVITLPVTTAKGILILQTGSGNTQSSVLRVDLNFVGQNLYGNMTLLDDIPRSNFAGPDIPVGLE